VCVAARRKQLTNIITRFPLVCAIILIKNFRPCSDGDAFPSLLQPGLCLRHFAAGNFVVILFQTPFILRFITTEKEL
jgi:hypothetical protein